jgi:proline iminopeptidase
VLFDQRGCGRSLPYGELRANTTQHLIRDIETLREHLGIERWLVLGSSWGSVLGLAYAERHPERVSELVLFSIGDPSRAAVEWMTRGVGRHYPEAWARFAEGMGDDIVGAYSRLLDDPDPEVRDRAARRWCAWEDAHVGVPPSPRYEDPVFRQCFARIVTHYWRHDSFLEEGELLRGLPRLAGIPGVLIHGRRDISGPAGFAEEIARTWGELILVDEGHHGGPQMFAAVRAATDGYLGGEQSRDGG